MTRIAHISDLHFGREDPIIVKGLLAALAVDAPDLKPDLIVVSGDFTQRAKKKQFRRAQSFLSEMPRLPRLVVPGNHDVSTTNLYERMAHPLRRYKRFIARDLEPFLLERDAAIAGLSTVRVLASKDGRINRKQVRTACARLTEAAAGCVRIVVTHHPVDLPLSDRDNAIIARADEAMQEFAACGVDLFLSGHLHTGQSVATGARYRIAGHSAVVAHAGTAVSTRTRGEPNSWNLIDVAAEKIAIRQMIWDGKAFTPAAVEVYRKGAGGWSLEAGRSG